MNWDVSYTVSRSIVLQIGEEGELLAGNSVSRMPQALAEDGLPVLLAFAGGCTPASALEKLRSDWEIDDAGFTGVVDALLAQNLLTPAPAPPRELYLVLGLNRSGTSALTKSLAACGVTLDFGVPALQPGLWKPDANRADGGYESHEIPAILALVRQIAARSGGDQNKPSLTEETVVTLTDALAIGGLLELIPRFPFAIKDPLLTFQFPQWKEIAQGCRPPIAARPVVTLRHPAASAHALLKRGFCTTLRSGLDQWLRYYSEVKFLAGRGEGPLIVVYDGQRDRYVAQIEALCARLSLPFDRERVSAEFVPAGVDRPDAEELRRHPMGNTLQELFEELESAAVSS